MDSAAKNDIAGVRRRRAEEVTAEGSAAFYVGRYRDALELYEEALTLDGGVARALAGKGMALAQLGRAAEGLDLALAALAADPGYFIAYNALGLCYHRLGREEEAREAYERGIAVSRENPRVLYNYACYWSARGDGDKCREYLTRAFQYLDSDIIEHSKKDPDLVEYIDRGWFRELHQAAKFLEKGVTEFMAERFDESAAAFREALALDADHIRAHAGLALSLAQLGSPAEGLASAEEAVRLNANYVRGYAAKAVCLKRLKRLDEARETFEYALSLAPKDNTVLYNYACYWAEIGDAARCRSHLSRALENDDGLILRHAPRDPDMARYVDADWFRDLLAEARKNRPRDDR
jgi:tetratricopeptide (TPR) repeat protein